MQSPDRQRLAHILDYCVEIEKTIARYGADFSAFDHDADYGTPLGIDKGFAGT